MSTLIDLIKLNESSKNSNNFRVENYNKPDLGNSDLEILCNEFYINDNLDIKIEILNILCRYNYDICFELFQKTNVSYMYNPDISTNLEILLKIVRDSVLPIELKYESAKLIYNENTNNENNIAYSLFLLILQSKNIHNVHSLIRIQILGYLLETEMFKKEIMEIFRDFVLDDTLTQSFKYQTILEFC